VSRPKPEGTEEFVESRTERLSPLSEVILDLRRNFSVHNARDDAVALQLPKLLGQHLLRDARNRALEVGEAQRLAAKEMEEDDELPATIQPSDGLLNPGGSRRGRVCALTHGCVPHFRVRSCAPSRVGCVVHRCRHTPTRRFTGLGPSRPVSLQTRPTPTQYIDASVRAPS
jgi:hypothetical protein